MISIALSFLLSFHTKGRVTEKSDLNRIVRGWEKRGKIIERADRNWQGSQENVLFKNWDREEKVLGALSLEPSLPHILSFSSTILCCYLSPPSSYVLCQCLPFSKLILLSPPVYAKRRAAYDSSFTLSDILNVVHYGLLFDPIDETSLCYTDCEEWTNLKWWRCSPLLLLPFIRLYNDCNAIDRNIRRCCCRHESLSVCQPFNYGTTGNNNHFSYFLPSLSLMS